MSLWSLGIVPNFFMPQIQCLKRGIMISLRVVMKFGWKKHMETAQYLIYIKWKINGKPVFLSFSTLDCPRGGCDCHISSIGNNNNNKNNNNNSNKLMLLTLVRYQTRWTILTKQLRGCHYYPDFIKGISSLGKLSNLPSIINHVCSRARIWTQGCDFKRCALF